MNYHPNYEQRFKWLLKMTTYLWLNSILLIVGLLLCVFASGWLQAVGTSIVASAIVGLLFFYQLRIDRQFDEARKIYDEYGLISITAERSNKELYRVYMQRSKHSFDIIGHSLSRLYDDLARDLLPPMDRRGVKIRLLLLDPDSPFVNSRESEDAPPERVDLAAEIRKSVKCYRSLNLTNMKIKYYNCTPTLTYQKIDDLIFAGSYFVGLPSGREAALVLRANHELAIPYQKHFELIWENFSRDAE